MGYIGQSMSVNALNSYNQGEKPISVIKNKDKERALMFLKNNNLLPENFKIKLWQFKDFLRTCGSSSWHHTGKYYNETNFYSFAYSISSGKVYDIKYLEKDNVDLDMLETFIQFSKKVNVHKTKKNINNKDYYFAEVAYEEWQGSRKHPKLIKYKDTAIIYGSFAYLLKHRKRKNISGTYFYITKSYTKRKPRNFNKFKVARIRKELKL